tara:strand:+ start:4899 stop:5033 length:135 start_codon:yes stop_codon:yes gene_type:complete
MFDLEKKLIALNKDYKRLDKKRKEIQLIKLRYAIRKDNSTKINQ